MATVLETENSLNVDELDNFILSSIYSGEVNPNITFSITFSVTDGVNAIQGAIIEINSAGYTTDANGQVIIDLVRGDYTANISATGYIDKSVNFTILDQNITENVVMVKIGSFGDSYDDSYEK